jgi:G:T-mismatch repair DNA endonuclease (very short patch repair protein)
VDLCIPSIRYTGNYSFWVTFKNKIHKNPDFKVNHIKAVIEVFGTYWHRNDSKEELIKQYNEIDYECLIIDEDETKKDMKEVKNKIISFVNLVSSENIRQTNENLKICSDLCGNIQNIAEMPMSVN